MRIKRMAIILFIFVVLACLPFVRDMLMGYRVVPDLQNYYSSSNDVIYISYFVLIMLFVMLLFPIIYKRKESIKTVVDTGGFAIKKLSVKIEIEKNGIYSKIYVRRIK